MRLIRIHVDAALAIGQTIALPESAAQHVSRVLRLDVGDTLRLFNGDGREYAARLSDLGRKSVSVTVTEAIEVERESPLRLVLAQALARGEKMDWILQKATELGVTELVPIITERTEVRLDGERSERRLNHWRGVLISACQQCGRVRLPSLHEPTTLGHWLTSLSHPTLGLTLDPDGSETVNSLPTPGPDTAIALVVGPEGGFSERDLAQLRAARFHGLRLGPRILRTETAGPAALAMLQARFGDCG